MTDTAHPGLRRDLIGLAAWVVLCLAVSAVGGLITAGSVESWYPTLEKPSFNPPSWVFAPVWTVLYVAMGVAAWRVWRRRHAGSARALVVFGVQLALNLLWSALFFGLQNPGLALIEIVVLLIAMVVCGLMFWRIDRWAGLLFVPYAGWVAFATVLNAAIWSLN